MFELCLNEITSGSVSCKLDFEIHVLNLLVLKVKAASLLLTKKDLLILKLKAKYESQMSQYQHRPHRTNN